MASNEGCYTVVDIDDKKVNFLVLLCCDVLFYYIL